jgi:hypothetical protein
VSNKSSLKSENSDEEILRVARERFDLAQEATSNIRKLGLEDLKFRAGEQWPEEVKRDREQEGRPSLVINKIPQHVRQITNDQRQNRPSIKVYPVDDKADIETAKIFQGMIRHIENNSNADAAYDTAFGGAVTSGFGYFRFVTDYVDPFSFDQEILFKRIRNNFTVSLDPNAQEPDGSDANWGFISRDVPKEDFCAEHPDADLSSMDDWTSIGNSNKWVTKDTVKVAEYFYKEFKYENIVLLNNGESFKEDEIPEVLPNGIKIVKKRKSQIPIIKWCKINGSEILERTDWLGRWIPIVPVYGDELDIDGEIIYEGIVRHAKDSQRMYNYMASTEAEAIALAPKAPFIVAEGQILPQFQAAWKSANRKTHAYLEYKPTSIGGQPVGAPQRNAYEAPVGAITNARMQSADDIKSTTGIYDSALGAQSREISGVAIRGRQAQSQTGNFHFVDNLTRSLRHAGRILVDLIPKVYDTPRVARIIGEEGEQEIVRINEIFNKNGKNVIYNLSAGKYDVVVETGPGYATKRQEALASMLDLTQAYPKIAEVAGDLMVKNMDWPGAAEIAERLKRILPPGIADEKEKQPLPPEAQMQLQQQSQLIEQLTEKLNQATQTINTKSNELESKERIELKKLENDIIIEQMKLQGAAANMLFAQELKSIQERLTLLNYHEPVDEEQFQNQVLNEPGQDMSVVQNDQQLTGELLPGQSMEEFQ